MGSFRAEQINWGGVRARHTPPNPRASACAVHPCMDGMDDGPSQSAIPQIRIVMLGETGVGKSCLVMRYCDDLFQPNMMNTIGVDYRSKSITVEGQKYKVEVWDT